MYSLPSVTDAHVDKTTWWRRKRGEGQPAVSLCSKLITSQQYYCTIEYSINTACLLRVTPNTPLLPITFSCVWTHAMNSWHYVYLLHILELRCYDQIWQVISLNQIPNKNTFPNNCFFNELLQWPYCYFNLPQGKWILCAPLCLKHNLMHCHIVCDMCQSDCGITVVNTYLFTFQKGKQAKKLFSVHFHPFKSPKPIKISYFKNFMVTLWCILFTLKYTNSKRKFIKMHQATCFYLTKVINNSQFSQFTKIYKLSDNRSGGRFSIMTQQPFKLEISAAKTFLSIVSQLMLHGRGTWLCVLLQWFPNYTLTQLGILWAKPQCLPLKSCDSNHFPVPRKNKDYSHIYVFVIVWNIISIYPSM